MYPLTSKTPHNVGRLIVIKEDVTLTIKVPQKTAAAAAEMRVQYVSQKLELFLRTCRLS